MPDIDSMTDEEIEEFLAGNIDENKESRGEATRTPARASRELVWVMLITAALGMIASLNLVISQISLTNDPSQSLLCDINSLISCSDFLRSDVNAIFFNIPNALFGLMFFSGIVGIALVLASGAEPARWLWRLLNLGMLAAAVWLIWFQITAVFVEKLLCPYCLVTWIVTIPLIVHVFVRSVEQGHIPLGGRALSKALVSLRWWLVIFIYIAVALIVVIGLWDKIALAF